jgi:hypothetical protein
MVAQLGQGGSRRHWRRSADAAVWLADRDAAGPQVGRSHLGAASSLPGNREARLLFAASAMQIVILSGFIKKTQKTPDMEIKLARKRLKELLQ